MDSSPEFGGTDAGTRPMELILIALGGCTGMDVASILEKMQVYYTDFKIVINAERANEHPKKFTKVHIKYSIRGNVPEEKFKKAIELSQTKYCPITEI
ncbi:MAG: OsmC family protein, partial [Candidatus Hadarchaeaceae archaeon]